MGRRTSQPSTKQEQGRSSPWAAPSHARRVASGDTSPASVTMPYRRSAQPDRVAPELPRGGVEEKPQKTSTSSRVPESGTVSALDAEIAELMGRVPKLKQERKEAKEREGMLTPSQFNLLRSKSRRKI